MGRLQSQSSELLSGSFGAELSLGPCRIEPEKHLEVSEILRLIIGFLPELKRANRISHIHGFTSTANIFSFSARL
jgi:hypothetical protein